MFDSSVIYNKFLELYEASKFRDVAKNMAVNDARRKTYEYFVGHGAKNSEVAYKLYEAMQQDGARFLRNKRR